MQFAKNSQLLKIGSNAFCNTGLAIFSAPPSLQTIEGGVFAGCAQLERIYLNHDLTTIGTENQPGAFQDTGLTEAHLPSGLKSITNNTFAGSQLKRIVAETGIQANL